MKLKTSHPALSEGRTIHPKLRKDPLTVKTLLKPVASNAKVGNGSSVITKGRWTGMPLFSLTLEERATCPPDCLRWAECYGNGMPFAHRHTAGPELETRLSIELAELARMYRHGFVVRLHILGDFYSVNYVRFWHYAMQRHPNLHVYGYTARQHGDIADALRLVRNAYADRWWVRISRNEAPHDGDMFASQQGTVPGAITCPEQTGKTASCLTCGLCWSTTKTIEFIDHDAL